jgi:uncharacterized membrane protein YfcA
VAFSPEQVLLLVSASVGAGIMNAMAGGGTILTYPALLLSSVSPIIANATSTVALWPGAATSLFGYRREVWAHKQWLRVLFIPSLVGGAIGAWLLIQTPASTFEWLAPFMVLFATVLFMVQGLIARRSGRDTEENLRIPGRLPVAWLFQLGIAIYGGYFGVGIGILMLAVLGFLGLNDIHAANGTKNFMGMCINGVAAAYFIACGAVNWTAALIMMGGAMAGGYAGARLARRIGRARARAAVVVIGLLVTAILLLRQLRSSPS